MAGRRAMLRAVQEFVQSIPGAEMSAVVAGHLQEVAAQQEAAASCDAVPLLSLAKLGSSCARLRQLSITTGGARPLDAADVAALLRLLLKHPLKRLQLDVSWDAAVGGAAAAGEGQQGQAAADDAAELLRQQLRLWKLHPQGVSVAGTTQLPDGGGFSGTVSLELGSQ
jgi:hypothetical protein